MGAQEEADDQVATTAHAAAEPAAPEEAGNQSDATEEFQAPEEDAVEDDASDNGALSEAFRTPDKPIRKKKSTGAEKDLLIELEKVKDPRNESALSDQQVDEHIVSGVFLETALGVVA